MAAITERVRKVLIVAYVYRSKPYNEPKLDRALAGPNFRVIQDSARTGLMLKLKALQLSLVVAILPAAAFGDEAAIRRNLPERLPQLPRIDEVSRTPIPGIWEIRMGTDVLYTDEGGDHLIEGIVLETKSKTNITEARINKLTAIDFASLPLKDAIAIKQGTGARKLAVFADPNCGYCKRLEQELLAIKDVTIYTFLYAVLGPDSSQKAKAVWCAKEPQKAWRAWMLEATPLASAQGDCDTSALDRNSALGRAFRVHGTPAVVFQDGMRVPGLMHAAQIERQLQISGKSP